MFNPASGRQGTDLQWGFALQPAPARQAAK
jgi:hypothetical protein